jgi:hypothetical protein
MCSVFQKQFERLHEKIGQLEFIAERTNEQDSLRARTAGHTVEWDVSGDVVASMKKGQVIISPRFALRGNVQALVEFYPKGTDGAHGDHASLFLHVYDPAKVRYSLRVDDGEYQEIETEFDGHSNDGFHNFCRVKENYETISVTIHEVQITRGTLVQRFSGGSWVGP